MYIFFKNAHTYLGALKNMAIITVPTNKNIDTMKLSGLSLNSVWISIYNSFISSHMSINESIFLTIFLEISWYLSKKMYSTDCFIPYKNFIIQIVLDILFIIEYLLSFVAKDVDVVVVVLTTFVLLRVFLFDLVDDMVAASFISASFVIASVVFVSLVVNCLSLLNKSKH